MIAIIVGWPGSGKTLQRMIALKHSSIIYIDSHNKKIIKKNLGINNSLTTY